MVRAVAISPVLAVILMLASPAAAGPLAASPSQVSRYDLATREDLLFAHQVGPFLVGDVGEWPILAGLRAQLGVWADPYLDARRIAELITASMPLEGQPLTRLEDLVGDCARTLGVERPVVYCRNSPTTSPYVVEAYGRCHLVLTSGLLRLFEGRPEELKFVVGRELGHVKCGHLALRRKAFGVLSAIRSIDASLVPEKLQGILPTLALGRLLGWCLESEISADRAGLLCCGDPAVAYEAMLRLLHGLAPDSTWPDPRDPSFKPDPVIKHYRSWQHRPFVEVVLDLKRQELESPFIPERLAALKTWIDSGALEGILGRQSAPDAGQLIEVTRIDAFDLAAEGETIDPYVILFDGSHQVLRTSTASGRRSAAWWGFKATDAGVEQPRSVLDGQPIFGEIWDDNYLGDTFIGGFVAYPDSRDATAGGDGARVAEYTCKIQWDWKDSTAIARPGSAKVTIRFTRKRSPEAGSTPGRSKAKP